MARAILNGLTLSRLLIVLFLSLFLLNVFGFKKMNSNVAWWRLFKHPSNSLADIAAYNLEKSARNVHRFPAVIRSQYKIKSLQAVGSLLPRFNVFQFAHLAGILKVDQIPASGKDLYPLLKQTNYKEFVYGSFNVNVVEPSEEPDSTYWVLLKSDNRLWFIQDHVWNKLNERE